MYIFFASKHQAFIDKFVLAEREHGRGKLITNCFLRQKKKPPQYTSETSSKEEWMGKGLLQ